MSGVIEEISNAITEWRLGQTGEFAALERIDAIVHDVGASASTEQGESRGEARVELAERLEALADEAAAAIPPGECKAEADRYYTLREAAALARASSPPEREADEDDLARAISRVDWIRKTKTPDAWAPFTLTPAEQDAVRLLITDVESRYWPASTKEGE